MSKKLIALLLALGLVTACFGASAETVKHERVFVVADAEGTVASLTASIRLENADRLEQLADRTLLTSLENVGGVGTFTLEGENLTWQAGGKDIAYQGTAAKAPALLPLVSLTLDGKPVTAGELKNAAGEAVMTVTYRNPDSLPALALSVMILPDSGVLEPRCENAAILSLMGRQVLVGWAVPGLDPALKLPDSFSLSFTADHPGLDWMMTLCSSEPFALACGEIQSRLTPETADLPAQITQVLKALANGENLPAVSGAGKDVVDKLNALNSGLTQLDNGAQLLVSGIKGVSENIGTLQSGLNDLKKNNSELNTGAAQLFEALLAAADARLRSVLPEDRAAALPSLTAGNYAETLDALLPTLDEKAQESLTALKAQLDQAAAFVTGLRSYTDGVAKAASGTAGLSFSAGALQLTAGALQSSGTAELKKQILGAEKSIAEKLLPYAETALSDAMRVYSETAERLPLMGYDLRPEGMKTVTVYIIRTDLQ